MHNFISIDLPWNGLAESKKIADYCKLKNYKISTHNYNGYLGTLMAANFAAMVSNFYIGEIDIDEANGVDKIFDTSPQINGRYLKIPENPGWGCNLNESKLKKVFNAKL